MEATKVLIVEESHGTREFLTELVQLLGFHASPVREKTDFLMNLHSLNPDLVLLGTCKHPGQLQDFAKVLHREKEGIPIVYISESPEPMHAGQPFNLKNSCCLPTTFNPGELKVAIERMIQRTKESELERLNRTIIGESPGILQIKKHIGRLSKSDVTVLITGESGTGKELAARAIHDLSLRAKRPFVKVNSAAVPGTLLESELFGYEKGAFTGAWQKKPGKFALAHSGSILLDEIGDLPFHLQAKLLQVLQDGELSALGSTTNTKIDVRVFAATNANPARMVPDGRFRADLYYRMNVVNIHIPPLRERLEDLDILCEHFLDKFADRHGNRRVEPSRAIRKLFYEYSWPGNVRELENVLQSIAVLGNEESFLEKIKSHAANSNTHARKDDAGPRGVIVPNLCLPTKKTTLKDYCREAARKAETEAIISVLFYTRWNRKKAARLLKISYKALLNRIKEYRIDEAYPDILGGDGMSSAL